MGNQNSKKQASYAREFGRRVAMGVMLGAAIGWVLIKRIRQEHFAPPSISGTPTVKEIDITEPVKASIETAPVLEPTPGTPEDLEAIRGIGPAYAHRLREAGINNYIDLARQSPEKLLEIVQARAWQAVDPQDWIEQARQLSQ
jgi:predicted flap endonuclease-1-like 5' DNA nuclease